MKMVRGVKADLCNEAERLRLSTARMRNDLHHEIIQKRVSFGEVNVEILDDEENDGLESTGQGLLEAIDKRDL